MKKINTLPNTDIAFIQYLQKVLRDNGIESVTRNENIALAGLSDRAAYDLSPELWVVDEEKFDEAARIIEELREGED